MTLEFLLRMALRGESGALEMLVLTLDRMAGGGMFDQLGGGFARYSTDGAWHVPHFEKMLYDNAQLAQLYTRAWLVTGEERLREVAPARPSTSLRELRQPEGGFSSSQDADTEGVEGGTFTWTWDELTALVGDPVAEAFGAAPDGQLGGHERPARSGRDRGDRGAARRRSQELRRCRGRADVNAVRRPRERAQPGVDDKVLTAWNALAIRALAEAGRAFDEPRYLEAAVACATFVHEHLRDDDGRLLRSWRDGAGGVLGVRGRPRAARRRVPDAVRDDLRPPVVRGRPRAVRAIWCGCSPTRSAVGSSKRAPTRSTSSCARRTSTTTPSPAGTRRRPSPSCGSPCSPGDAGVEREATRALALVRDAMAAAPTAFGLALVRARPVSSGRAARSRSSANRRRGDPGPRTGRRRKVFMPNAVLAVARPGDAAAEAECRCWPDGRR